MTIKMIKKCFFYKNKDNTKKLCIVKICKINNILHFYTPETLKNFLKYRKKLMCVHWIKSEKNTFFTEISPTLQKLSLIFRLIKLIKSIMSKNIIYTRYNISYALNIKYSQYVARDFYAG